VWTKHQIEPGIPGFTAVHRSDGCLADTAVDGLPGAANQLALSIGHVFRCAEHHLVTVQAAIEE
jgi:hypothetical protein